MSVLWYFPATARLFSFHRLFSPYEMNSDGFTDLNLSDPKLDGFAQSLGWTQVKTARVVEVRSFKDVPQKKPKPGELVKKQPYLIQRCTLDRGSKKLCYEYMGSAEFERGDQAGSLRRMFKGKIETNECTVRAFDRDVHFYLVAQNGFPFGAYAQVIQGLISKEWKTKEQTFLDYVLQKRFRLVSKKRYSFVETEAWFDFANGVLFTLSQKDADSVVVALDDIKETWRQKEVWLNSPPVKKFQKELEKLKTRLLKAGKRWMYLDDIKKVDGKLVAWLNPMLQHTMGGFVTLEDLRDWLKDKGPIAESYKKEEQNSE